MNILNFNDGVSAEYFTRFSMPLKCAMAPVFYGQDLEQEKLAEHTRTMEARAPFLKGAARLPFPEIRVWLDTNDFDRKRGYSGMKSYGYSDGWSFAVMSFMQGKRVPRIGFFTRIMLDGTADSIHGAFHEERGGWLPMGEMDPSKSLALSGFAMEAFDSVAMFLSEVNSPANFLAKVVPDTNGKSVEWMAARTHYVVLHKSHPANAETVKAGESVKESDNYLKRQAHSRRAHFRILRSPKFRHKFGQRVWIKSCWCGPKEWKQSSSIYRLHE